MQPTIGRIVHYTLTAEDAERINRRRVENATRRDEWARGAIAHIGNDAHAGDVLAAMIVKVNDGDNCNLQVHLDGNDVYWITSINSGEEGGRWHWPPRV